MVAIRTNGGVGGTVLGPAGVVVHDRLIVKIDEVECAIGTDAGFDGAEPEVGTADELGFLASFFLGYSVTYTVGFDKFVMDDVERGLGGEVTIIPLGGPGPAFVDGATGGGGEATDLVDLHVGLLGPFDGGEGALIGDHALP